jgi:hypothetical protein
MSSEPTPTDVRDAAAQLITRPVVTRKPSGVLPWR